LGIVLYEILAGHIPFDGETTMSILLKQVTEPPPPIPGLSPAIQNVLNHALTKDVKERFQTPLEFARAFSAAVNTDIDHDTIQSTRQMDSFPEVLPATKKELERLSNPRPQWIRIALFGILILAVALSAFLFVKGLPTSPSPTITTTLPSATDSLLSVTFTNEQSAPLPLGPIAILRFQNKNSIADQATLIARAMPAPPPDSQYEIWLSGADERLSLGKFSPDNTGKGELTFLEPEGLNLLTLYDRVEISIEPEPDSNSDPSGLLAYSFTFPAEGLTHVRYLLSSFPNTPDKTSLVQGLYSDIQKIDELARAMQTVFENGDRAAVLQKGEEALLLLVGAKSGDHKDWNGNGQIDDISDGYGLLLNGDSFGYIQAVSAEADYTVSTLGATQFMIENGEVVKTCAQNLAFWTPQLRGLLLTILTSTSDSEISTAIHDFARLTDQILNGIDLDNNGSVDTASGECGAKTVYEYAYYMADMPILPVSISYQLTAVAGVTSSPFSVTPTKTPQFSQNTPAPAPNTARPRPTKKPNPTKRPHSNNTGP
jgi:Anti-sigma-K factor rskA